MQLQRNTDVWTFMHERHCWRMKIYHLNYSLMLFIPCQIHSHPCWLLLSLTVRCGHVSQTFHIMNSNPPSVFSPLQVDVSSTGAPRVAFKPDCRQLATSVRLLSEPIDRLQLNKTARKVPAAEPSPAAWAGLHHHGHRVHLLGLLLLLWTHPGIPQAWVRLNSWSVSNSVHSRLWFYLEDQCVM